MEKNFICIGVFLIGLTLFLNQLGVISHRVVGVGLGIGIGLDIIGVYCTRKRKLNLRNWFK